VVLASGTRLGAYEILSLLGAGGMGEVYLARDHRLNRQVALKVLPAIVASDPDRLARFEREAQVLAALNHPNIAAIYGVEDSGGAPALVMELVEGPTLADRIVHGPIPLDEALPIAKQIAEALEAAHEQGIIHRDLKPANIKVRDDGTVKVLDFGLAKAMEPVAASGASAIAMANSPTITSPAMMTGVGMLIGTAAYMSPEQAKGRAAGKRSDVWAFGCVLFEMLTGRRAFDGEDVSDTLANVLKSDPDWSRLPAPVPSPIRRLLRRSLSKDPRRRLADIADARLDLEDREEGSDPTAFSVQRRRSEWIAWCAVGVTLLLAGAAWFARSGGASGMATQLRLELTTPPTSEPESIAISPDGQTIAFVAESEGRSQLWVRSLRAEGGHPLAGTEDARYPFWSPDSASIAFFSEARLKRIDLASGAVTDLASVRRGGGGTWNRAGTILFNAFAGPILKVSDRGGDVAAVVPIDQNAPNGGYRAPQFLPDGRHFVYFAAGRASKSVLLGDLDGEPVVELGDSDAAPVYGASQVLLVRRGRVFSQPLDMRTLRLTGTPVPISADTLATGGLNTVPLSASANGTIVYRAAGQIRRRQFTWFDRSGTILGVVGEVDGANALNPSLSPNGQQIAYNRAVDNNVDIWLLDINARQPRRFTNGPAVEEYPIWSPDSTRLVFSAIRAPGFHVYEKPLSGLERAETLLIPQPAIGAKIATDWSADGRFLLYRHLSFETGYDIWAMPLSGDRKPFVVVRTESDEREGQFSPDGRWIAYESDQSGRMEIYVQAFPTQGRVFGPLSQAGGAQPRWNPDGKELFYLSPAGEMMSVKLRLDAVHDVIDSEAAVMLFRTRVLSQSNTPRHQYAVTRDGRFLINRLLDDGVSYPMSVILNWSGAKE
jgi:serine/threonine protein kinase/Tol biopolymer transport system component